MTTSEVEKEAPLTFCETLRRDMKIVKDAFKTKVIYRYFAFWFFVALEPSLGASSYFLITDVYGISDTQYGVLVSLSTVSMLLGIAMYQAFLRQYEMRTLQYVSIVLGLFSNTIDLLQFNRVNIKWGISDMVMLSFGSVVINSVSFALT